MNTKVGDGMERKEIIKKKVMSHFIDVTDELINEIGINNITIRNIANKAGYNSATIYNYFENLDHLIFFGAMKNMRDYAQNLNSYLIGAENAMDRFLKVWECFCDYAYYSPDIYNAIFLPKLDKNMEHYVSEYYSLFPEELRVSSTTISTMLIKGNIHARGMTTVMDCVSEGYIQLEDKDSLNEMTLLIFEGMLARTIRNSISYDDARNTTMDYIKKIVEGFLIKEYEFKF